MSEPNDDNVKPTAAMQQITADLNYLMATVVGTMVEGHGRQTLSPEQAASIVNTAIEKGVYNWEATNYMLQPKPKE